MKAYIIETFLGIFALDEKEKVIDKVLFEKDVKKIVDSLEKSEKIKKELIEKLKKKGYQIEDSGVKRYFLRKIAKDLGYSDIQLNQLLTEMGIEYKGL